MEYEVLNSEFIRNGGFSKCAINQSILDIAEGNRFPDPMGEAIKRMTDDIRAQKEVIIHERLKELSIDVDFSLEEHRRFKSFTVESGGGYEAYYYNDGSVDGLRVVTFTQRAPSNLLTDSKTFKIEYDIHY